MITMTFSGLVALERAIERANRACDLDFHTRQQIPLLEGRYTHHLHHHHHYHLHLHFHDHHQPLSSSAQSTGTSATSSLPARSSSRQVAETGCQPIQYKYEYIKLKSSRQAAPTAFQATQSERTPLPNRKITLSSPEPPKKPSIFCTGSFASGG